VVELIDELDEDFGRSVVPETTAGAVAAFVVVIA
jgi:hypothetical protein